MVTNGHVKCDVRVQRRAGGNRIKGWGHAGEGKCEWEQKQRDRDKRKREKRKGVHERLWDENRRQSIQAEKKRERKKKGKKEVSRSGKPEGNRYWGKGERKKWERKPKRSGVYCKQEDRGR